MPVVPMQQILKHAFDNRYGVGAINIVDWVLPRLLVGDRLTRADIVSLGHGGLLEDVPERPMPRNQLA